MPAIIIGLVPKGFLIEKRRHSAVRLVGWPQHPSIVSGWSINNVFPSAQSIAGNSHYSKSQIHSSLSVAPTKQFLFTCFSTIKRYTDTLKIPTNRKISVYRAGASLVLFPWESFSRWQQGSTISETTLVIWAQVVINATVRKVIARISKGFFGSWANHRGLNLPFRAIYTKCSTLHRELK